MALLTVGNMQALTDHFAAIYDDLAALAGSDDDQLSPVTGTLQKLAKSARDVVVDLNDYDLHQDLEQPLNNSFLVTNVETFLAGYSAALSGIDQHCSTRGSSVDSSIIDLSTFLSYYNAGANKFSSLLTPGFAKLWKAVKNNDLPVAGLMSPAIHPTFTSGVSANGMGKRAVGGAFVAGTAVDDTLYSAIVPLVEVVTDFVDGTAAPTATIAGTDDMGATDTTWLATLTGNNPDASVSTTITPSVTQGARQTVAVGSATNIIAGSILTIAGSAPDKEIIVVETVSGSNITAVFKKAHSAGAAVTGNDTYATTPSVPGRRLVSVSGITIGTTDHTAGEVRVVGKQDRGAI